ncbi:MAG TPA: DUF1553 domain-containing protein [Bryobacteraceae bacterium]|nr:DUF1553 domain-containing protein [Bryobacteraceae bacterium]
MTRVVLLFFAASLCCMAAEPASPKVDFDRQIRPILSDNCFTCHGPDEKNRMAGLRLDVQDGGAYARNIVVPGSAKGSLLFARISNPDQNRRMPPPASGHSLTSAQIDLIREWIDQGAKWETHWAFVAPKRPPLAEVRDKSWVRNPIDDFVLAKLEAEGLKPSPEAGKAILLRRVTYDLTGLPPTVAELNSFLADKSPDAYEKRVDALLASPRYGERMASQWLDLARYADTHGYHIDNAREMWRWRDWVIAAYNRNMPYDQFTIEQLAGDLLPNATTEQKIASGFNRNHMINFEGGAIPEEYQVEYVVDRVEATSATWMGLTLGCARCHDHKYDPISQRDFYRFFAFFNNVSEKGLDGRTGNAEPFLQLPSAEQAARKQELNSAIAALEKELPDAAIAAKQAVWEKTELAALEPAPREALEAHYAFDGNLADSSGHYLSGQVLKGDLTYSPGAADRGAEFDGETHLALGNAGVLRRDKAFAVAFWLKVNSKLGMTVLQQKNGLNIRLDDFELSGIQQRVPKLYVSLPGIEVRTAERLPWPELMNHVVIDYDGSGSASGIGIYVNSARVKVAVLKSAPAAASTAVPGVLEIGNAESGAPFKGRLDDLRLYSRPLASDEIARLHALEPLRAILPIQASKRSKEQQAWIRDYYLTNAASKEDRAAWSDLKNKRTELKHLDAEIPTTMVMSELAKPRQTFILARGDYRNQTEKVSPGVPGVLPPLPKDAPLNRLTLAKWLLDPANPLTARVAANRYWQMHFGTGLVKTAENFGSQGDPPSNRELLDWLATEFIGSGWNVKAMQRLIVTSAAYRQSSRVTPELLEKDPENRLLARGPRFRLSAEMIRDGDLYMGGLLKEQAGGPGVHPYQPKGLWEEIAFGDGFTAQAYTQDHGPALWRRSIYTFWKRTSPPPEMITFDAPDREKCTARRTITNTPLQALALLNDPAFVEAGRALAARMIAEGGGSADARIRWAFRLATAREAEPRELSILRDELRAEEVEYKRDPLKAKELIAVGESAPPAKVAAPELAAYTVLAGMILNLDETITRE